MVRIKSGPFPQLEMAIPDAAPEYRLDATRPEALAFVPVASTLVVLRGPEDVATAVEPLALARARKEHFVVLLLNARHAVLRVEVVSVGSLNASIVHPREVFAPALEHAAASVVLVHNHPSGDSEPSEEDLKITQRLVDAGELLGVAVLDHVIVAKRGNYSFRANGKL